MDARLSPSYDVDSGLQYDWQSTSWTVGLSLDLPWNRIPQRNSYRNALITLEVRKRAVEAETDGIVASVRDAIRVLDNARISFQLQEIAVEIAERRVESTRLNLDYGQASTRDVLESEEGPPGGPQQPRLGPRQPHPRASRPPPRAGGPAGRRRGDHPFDQDLIASIEAQPTP